MDKALYCTHCGREVGSSHICPHCGARNEFLGVARPESAWALPGAGSVSGALEPGRPASEEPDRTRKGSAKPPTATMTDVGLAPPGSPQRSGAADLPAQDFGSQTFDFLDSGSSGPPAGSVPGGRPSPPPPGSPPQREERAEQRPSPPPPPKRETDELPEGADITFSFLDSSTGGKATPAQEPPGLAAPDVDSAPGPAPAPPQESVPASGATFILDDLDQPSGPPEPAAAASPTAVSPVLVRQSPPRVGEVHALHPGVNTMGTLDDNDVHLAKAENKGVSRRHAQITVKDLGGEFQCVLEDNGSLNGTFLNDGRVSRPMALTEGDTFRLGTIAFTFELRAE